MSRGWLRRIIRPHRDPGPAPVPDPAAVRERLQRRADDDGFVKVRLTVLSEAEGGRRGPFFQDYRPDWDIASPEGGINGAPVLIDDADQVAPGGEAVVRLLPISPELWRHVRPGMEIKMHEGPRVVGHAVVLEVRLREI